MAATQIPAAPSAADYPALRTLGRKRSRGRVPFVPQMQVAECGAACLTMVLRYLGHEVRLDELRSAIGIGRDGSSMGAIARAAERFGLRARGIRADMADVRYLPRATILHWNMTHFVVFESANAKGVQIVDPSAGRRFVSWAQFGKSWTGVGLVLEPTSAFRPIAAGKSRLLSYLAALLGERGSLGRVLTMSVVLRVLATGLPLLTALVVDRIVPRADIDLLLVVGTGLTAVIGFQCISQLIRAHLLLELRTKLDVRLTLGFLEHLVALPFTFFQTRSAGDLMMRVNSNTQMREILTSNTLSAPAGRHARGRLPRHDLRGQPEARGRRRACSRSCRSLLFWVARTRYRELMSQQLEVQAESHGYLVAAHRRHRDAQGRGRRARCRRALVEHVHAIAQRRRSSAVDSRRSSVPCWASVKSGAPLIVMCIGATMAMSGEIQSGRDARPQRARGRVPDAARYAGRQPGVSCRG